MARARRSGARTYCNSFAESREVASTRGPSLGPRLVGVRLLLSCVRMAQRVLKTFRPAACRKGGARLEEPSSYGHTAHEL